MPEFLNIGRTDRALSVIGGAGMIFAGMRRSQHALTTVGAALFLRGAIGWCPLRALGSTPRSKNASVDGTFSIRWKRGCTLTVPPEQAFAYLRDLSNLAQFCPGVGTVQPVNGTDTDTQWMIFDADGMLSCTIDIINEELNQRLAWRSLSGAAIAHAGSIEFRPGPAGAGTEVLVTVSFAPGLLGRIAHRLARDTASLLLAEALRRFKQRVEAGELAVGAPPESDWRETVRK